MANLDNIVRELKSERDRLDKAIHALSGLTAANSNSAARPQPGRRRMSAAARARISAAQKARWAKSRGQHKGAPIASKGKRRLSAAGRARIIAATKARWAKIRAGKK